MKKRGISAVVATVLIILLVVSGVGIVWLGIMPMIKDINIDKSAGLRLVSNEGHTLWDPESRLATVQIERAADGPDIYGIDIVFSFSGNSVTHFVEDVPGVNGKKVYYVNLSEYSGELDSIKIVPIFWGGIVGDVASELKIEKIPEVDIVEMIKDEVIAAEEFVEPTGYSGGGGGSRSNNGGSSGGGNNEETPEINEMPIAVTSNNFSADENTIVILDGSASSDPDGTIVSYLWTQTAGLLTVIINSPTSANANFTAPDLNSSNTLTFELRVTDDKGAVDTDSINITINPVTNQDVSFVSSRLNPLDHGCNFTLYDAGTTYYVSNSDGDDSNDGLTLATPFRSFTKGFDRNILNPGDKILFKKGDTWSVGDNRIRFTGEPGRPYYYGSYGTGDKPKLVVSGGAGPFYFSDIYSKIGHFIIDGFDISSESGVGGRGVFPVTFTGCFLIKNNDFHDLLIAIQSGADDGMFIYNNRIVNNADQGILGGISNGTGLDISNNYFDSNGWGCDRQPNVYCHNLYLSTGTDVLIENNTFLNGSNYGIVSHGHMDNYVIRNNYFENNNHGIAVDCGYSPEAAEEFHNVTVENNVIKNSRGDLWTLSFAGITNGVVRNNLVYSENGAPSIQFRTCPNVSLRKMDNFVIEENTFYNFYDIIYKNDVSSSVDLNYVRNNVVVCSGSDEVCFGNGDPEFIDEGNNFYVNVDNASKYFLDLVGEDYRLNETFGETLGKGWDPDRVYVSSHWEN